MFRRLIPDDVLVYGEDTLMGVAPVSVFECLPSSLDTWYEHSFVASRTLGERVFEDDSGLVVVGRCFGLQPVPPRSTALALAGPTDCYA